LITNDFEPILQFLNELGRGELFMIENTEDCFEYTDKENKFLETVK